MVNLLLNNGAHTVGGNIDIMWYTIYVYAGVARRKSCQAKYLSALILYYNSFKRDGVDASARYNPLF